jgi:hypothetical protein
MHGDRGEFADQFDRRAHQRRLEIAVVVGARAWGHR